jgi:ferredoxin-NADP reductase
MDYPGRTRLKVLGRVRVVEDARLLAKLEVPDYRARVERAFMIRVEAFDWNCPQHITPRYTEAEVKDLMASLIDENRLLQARQGPARRAALSLGRGPLKLVVSGIRQLTPRVRAFELRPHDGGALPEVGAGSHVQVPVRLEDGSASVRQYSICSDPARRDAYEIAVLRDDSGAGGSRAVHELFDIGVRLQCGLPQNHFPLHADTRPAVLVAGGIGITPIKAMAHVLKRRGAAFELHYASRSAQEASFLDELVREFGKDLTLHLSAEGRRARVREILAAAPADAVFYVCGPERLIVAAQRDAAALGIDGHRLRVERFTVDTFA